MALDDAGLRWLNEGLPAFMRGLQQASGAMEDVGDRSERAGGGLNVLGGIAAGVSMAVVNLAVDVTTKLAKALIGIGVDAVKVAADFESLTAKLQIAGKAAADQAGVALEELDEIAIAVGGDTRLLGVSATGAASAMTSLFKSGLSVSDIFGDVNAYMEEGAELGGALRASIDLAAASDLDMAQAADLATVVMASFGEQAKESGMTTDEFIVSAMNNLVKAADASVAEVPDLAEALKMVGPSAAAAGIPLEDVNNMLAILSTRGRTGSEAGTGLDAMLRSLVSPSKEAGEELERLGIAIFDEEGAMLSAIEIIAQFELALGDATDAEREASLGAIFTAAGRRAMLPLIDEGTEGYYEMAEATEAAASMEEQAALRAQTFAGQMEALEGTVETLKVRIGSALLPILTELATEFSGFIEEYGPLVAEAFQNIVDWAVENWPSFRDTILEVLQTVGSWISENWPPIRDTVLEVLQAVSTWVGENWPGIRDTIIEVVSKVTEVLSELPGSIAWIIKNFDEIKSWVDTNWPLIQAVIETVWKVLSDVFQTVRDVIVEEVWPQLQAAWTEIQAALEELGIDFEGSGTTLETLGKIFKTVAMVIGAVLIGLVGIVTSIVGGIARVIRGLAETWRKVTENIKGFIEGIAEVFAGIMEIIKGISEKDTKRIQRGIFSFWKGLWKTVKNFVGIIVKAITLPFKAIIDFVGGFIDTIVKFFTNLKKKLVGGSIIPDMMKKIKDTIEGILEDVRDFIKGILEGIAEKFTQIFESIKQRVEVVLRIIKGVIAVEIGRIKRAWDTFVEDIKDAWDDLWSSVEDAVDDAKAKIRAALDNLTSTIKGAWDNFTNDISTAWDTLWNSLSGIIDAAKELVWTSLESFKTMITDAWSGPGGLIENLTSAWDDFWANLSVAVSEAWSSVITAISEGIASIRTWLTTNIERVTDIGATIVGAIATGLSDTWDRIVEAVGEGIDRVIDAVNFLGELWVKITTIGSEIVEGIKTGLAAAWETITTRIGELLTNIISTATGIWETVVEEGKKIVSALIAGLSAAWGTFVSWLSNRIGAWLCESFGICGEETEGPHMMRARQGAVETRLAGALPAFAMTTAPSVDRSRTITINMDQSFLGGPQEADTFILDVQAALAAARI